MILALTVTEAELAELEAAHLRSLGSRQGGSGGSGPDEGQGDRPGVDAGPPCTPTEARHSLAARGLLTEAGSLAGAEDDDGVALVVRTTLDVRSSAPRTIVVDRLVATPDRGRTEHGLRLVHLLGDVACVEDVTATGARHLWLVLDPAEVPHAVAGVTVPERAVPGTGPSRRVPAGPPEVMLDLLDGPTVVATLSVLDHDRRDGTSGRAATEEHLLALGPGGCWVAQPEAAAGRSRPAGGDLVFRPVSPAWVADHVRGLLRPGPARSEGTMTG